LCDKIIEDCARLENNWLLSYDGEKYDYMRVAIRLGELLNSLQQLGFTIKKNRDFLLSPFSRTKHFIHQSDYQSVRENIDDIVFELCHLKQEVRLREITDTEFSHTKNRIQAILANTSACFVALKAYINEVKGTKKEQEFNIA
jgi:uncharacterized protein YaaN involved in tellurite resistance